jgi:hypothetical protein
VRLTIALFALGTATAAGAQTPAPIPRLATLPWARCDSTRPDSLADSTLSPLDSVDVLPREVISADAIPTIPDSLRFTDERTHLKLVIDRTGRVNPCQVWVVGESSPAWTEAVLKALRKARYSPAQRHGVTVAVRVIQPFRWYAMRRPLR